MLVIVSSAWGIRVKVYKPGDTFDIGEAYIYFDDQEPGDYIHTTGAEVIVPELVYNEQDNQWSGATDWLPCDKKVFKGSVMNGPAAQNIYMTPPNDVFKNVQPLGVRVKSGKGTQEDPYCFELVYGSNGIPRGGKLTITWDESTVNEIGIGDMEPGDSFIDEIFGIRVKIPRGGKLAGGNITMNMDNQIVFRASDNALISGMEINCASMGEATKFSYGWTKTGEGKLTWSGDPTQVVTLTTTVDDNFVNGITQIEFTLVSGYALTAGDNLHGTVTFRVHGNEVTAADEGDKVMVQISPDEGWATGGMQGQWQADAAMTPAEIDQLKDFELTPVEGNANAYTFTMKSANAEFSVNYRKLLTHTDITIPSISDVTYTGQALTPAVTVKDGETVLTKDQDFTVSYADNENVGTGKVTIVGIGLYSGQVVKEFTINQADITGIQPTIRAVDADGTSLYFDLQGRLLNRKPGRGLFIGNGKKIISR